jgi:hypothetical protein
MDLFVTLFMDYLSETYILSTNDSLILVFQFSFSNGKPMKYDFSVSCIGRKYSHTWDHSQVR